MWCEFVRDRDRALRRALSASLRGPSERAGGRLLKPWQSCRVVRTPIPAQSSGFVVCVHVSLSRDHPVEDSCVEGGRRSRSVRGSLGEPSRFGFHFPARFIAARASSGAPRPIRRPGIGSPHSSVVPHRFATPQRLIHLSSFLSSVHIRVQRLDREDGKKPPKSRGSTGGGREMRYTSSPAPFLGIFDAGPGPIALRRFGRRPGRSI
jgi:hypothetical protein